ncbi:MAG TPA: ferrochelatase [Longimicrobiales bacterium]|nr:ferrochelatase [Longimicrobiales bacterium]
MRTAVLLLNFGEPEHATMDEVVPFLERIFNINVSLEDAEGAEGRARSRRLAEARAPGLIEEYELIGGSPLLAQATEQRDLLESELRRRGHDVTCILGMQFTPPFIADAVKQARATGAERVVALPIYPLCGPSTTVAALERVESDMKLQLWNAPVFQVSGWHPHPGYIELRANAIREVLRANGLSLDDPRTKLVFSAHGTPMKYIHEGSRYDIYVRDFCATLARAVGAPSYEIGYQNHTNRPIDWTQPDVEKVIAGIDAERVVVDAVSFMHEQSETLAELDHELKEEAEERGLGFFRVPIPHAAPAFIEVLADLVEPYLHPDAEADAMPAGTVAGQAWQPCRCKPGASCLNAGI